ncbi:Transmembrane protein [Entamoeba marina]
MLFRFQKKKTQQTKINYDIHTIFIPGGITTVTFESIFNSIFLFNARIILQKPIKCTFFQAINSTIVFDGGNINTHILFLDNMSLLTKKPTAIYINTRNGTIHNVSATTIIPPTIPCTTILQLTLSYCTSPLKLFGKRQCTVVTNKDLIDLNGDVVYKEDYCPCSDCIFVINRTDPTGIIHSFTNIGGIHCTTKCSVQSKRSFSVGEVSGEFIEIMSPVIIEKYIPIQGGILLLPKDTVLIGVVNTNSMGRVIAKAIIHFCGNAVNGIRFEIHQSMAFLKQGNEILIWTYFQILFFSGDFRVEESIAPIRLLRQSTIEFKEKARIYFHTYVDTWNHDVLYLLFSEKRKFGSDVQLPPFYLVDKKTSEIHPGGRLFKECFGKWIMYKLGGSIIVDCDPNVKDLDIEETSRIPWIIVVLIVLVFGLIFWIWNRKKSNQVNRFRNDLDDVGDDKLNNGIYVISDDDEFVSVS